MRKIIGGFATSIDGFIESPNGENDWIVYDQEQFAELAESWKRIAAMFHGRKTYEASLKMKGEVSEEITNSVANMKHYGFSNTLETVEDPYILVKGDEIAVFGGAGLLSSLMNLDLIDELGLAICPTVLGEGKPFLPILKNAVTGR